MKFILQEKFNGKSIESVLIECHVPKKELHWLRMSKDIKVNNEVRKLTDTVVTGDRVDLPDFNHKSNYKESGQQAKIVFEDDNLLVAQKSAGQKVHPNDPGEHNTLVNDVISSTISPYVEPVHRLDVDTSGIVLFAKNAYMKKILDYMLAKNEIERIYKAHVKLGSKINKQTVNAPLGRKPHTNLYHVTREGKTAITHIIEVKKLKHYEELTVELETGRTHQIRAHLKHLNAPIIGDKLYGGPTSPYMHLYGYQVSFTNPLSGEKVNVTMVED
ncbi:RluA family pseudouridine synthase [Jeotgalicoccus sp. ATCC 8456]|uniref:RluA family pseudouridine synthase n=1 Tax=Jeotgalicoccus sp. ATCC 8456 TaxID=946435 RepID=UPI0018E5CDD9|nr:RluA family pseudouridine synthase [Jeotgalicoccus sp. ATCC 8456]QQD85115.1 RluA family pseudouridine synthase [Jeotgalicoccus sp. ATCC 8456]